VGRIILDEWDFILIERLKADGRSVSAEEAEKFLLEELEKSGPKSEDALWNLAIFYSKTKRQSIALNYIKRLVDNTDDPEKKGLYFLSMGQFMEKIGDYDSAITFYKQAFSLEPTDSKVWYYVNNNLGYCLNHFGRHQEAERYCQAAIKINPQKYNAYKNLGISLEGQGKYSEAANLYVVAVRLNPTDPRALVHLENLVTKHGEVSLEVPDIYEKLEECREVVKKMREFLQKFEKESDEPW
jgi:tetratricopeptide (TPR) repeat protein